MLQERQQELRSFIDTANAPIFGIDAHGKVNEWNNKVHCSPHQRMAWLILDFIARSTFHQAAWMCGTRCVAAGAAIECTLLCAVQAAQVTGHAKDEVMGKDLVEVRTAQINSARGRDRR